MTNDKLGCVPAPSDPMSPTHDSVPVNPRVRAERGQREFPDEGRAYLLRALFGPDPEQPFILIRITPRQQEILAEVVHDRFEAEREHGDDRDHLAELTNLDELIRGAHPRWNGQQQAFFPSVEADH